MASSPTAPAAGESVSGAEYAQRFGALLRRNRRRRPLELRRLAARSGHTLSPQDLLAYERGQRVLDPQLLERLCDLYGIPFESILPEHRAVVIDLEQRKLTVGGTVYPLPDSDDPAPHLQRYVRIVNRLRSQPMRGPATLRREDAEALAEALELDADDVTELLAEVIGQDAAARRRTFMLRSGTGTLAAVVVVGAGASALDARASESETVVLAAAEIPYEDAGKDAGGDEQAGDGEQVTIPPSERVAGPDLVPSASLPPAPESDESPADEAHEPEAHEPEFEDETNIDAPGGPVTIEREDYEAEKDEDEAQEADSGAAHSADDAGDEDIEDETVIDAEGGPVMIERDEWEAEQEEDEGEDSRD